MRQKLAHSQKVLEGLTLENYGMIVENAEALKKLSEDARWQVSPNINYLRMSSEFQDQAQELITKAKQKNLDGAILAYLRLTMNCVKCHQYTRENRITRLDRGSQGSGSLIARDVPRSRTSSTTGFSTSIPDDSSAE